MPAKKVIFNPLSPARYKQRLKPYPEIATIPLRVKSQPAWTIEGIGGKPGENDVNTYAYAVPGIDQKEHKVRVPQDESPDALLSRNVQMARLRFGYYPTHAAHKASHKYGVPMLLFNALDTHRTLWLMRSRKLDLTALKAPSGESPNPLETVALSIGFYGLPQANGIPLPNEIAEAIEDAVAFLWNGENMNSGPKPGKIEQAARRLWDRIKPPPQPEPAPDPKGQPGADGAPAQKKEYPPGHLEGLPDTVLVEALRPQHKNQRSPQANAEIKQELQRRHPEPTPPPEEKPPERVFDVGMMAAIANRDPKTAAMMEKMGVMAAMGSEQQGAMAVESVLSSVPYIPSFFMPEPEIMQEEELGGGDWHESQVKKWSPITIIEPPRTIRCDVVPMGVNKQKALDEGVIFRFPNRWCVDKAVFGCKRKGYGVSILFDISGSMQLGFDAITEMLERFPVATIAMYSGARGSPRGRLWLVAKRGYRVSKEGLAKMFQKTPNRGANQCDLPALQWLAKQMKPQYWVSDGCVTMEDEGVDITASQQVYDFVLRNNIKQAHHLDHMQKILKGTAEPLEEPNVILMPGFNEDNRR